MQLLLYTPKSTSRIVYISAVLLKAIGVEDFNITSNIAEYKSFAGPKINYASQPVGEKECWICPVELLLQTGIKDQSINCFEWNETKAFFKTSNGDLPFDLFAASFYLLTRYEEYLPHQKDEYGRFAHTNSLAFKEGFLQLPLINIWLQHFSALLKTKFPSIQLKPAPFKYIPTYDVDIAWSYFSKGFVRNLAGFISSFIKSNWSALQERKDVLLGYKDDPFDVYEWLDELHREHRLQPIYFFLLAKSVGKYDKNINPNNRYFKLLMRKLSVMYAIGIHPSWQSGDNKKLVETEAKLLAKITDQEIGNSRQHYIRFTLPQTFQQLIAAGIQHDYSMGYGSINGYRASYCLPYYWYDLSKEETTELMLYPYCYMEANSLFEQHLSAEQALEELIKYYTITKQVNGIFITIFHNHLLTQQPQQIAWRNMYASFLKKISTSI